MLRLRASFVLLFGYSLLWALGVMAQPACTIPQKLAQPKVPGIDWKNATARTDYFALALSWSPEHCAHAPKGAAKKFQCTLNHFAFVVHGLWPQSSQARNKFGHPRHCHAAAPLERSVLRRHLCTVPGVDLMQGEWTKHGTCAFSTPEAYFHQIETLRGRLQEPDMQVLYKEKRANLTAGDIVQAFVNANRNSALPAEGVTVQVGSGNFLREVLVCYDLQYAYQACHLTGTPLHQKIKVRF